MGVPKINVLEFGMDRVELLVENCSFISKKKNSHFYGSPLRTFYIFIVFSLETEWSK